LAARDYDWTNASGSNTNALFPGLRDSSKIKSLSFVTGRVGYAWDRFLGYVKGGGAWERDEYAVTGDSGGGSILATGSETRSGWTVGIGGEYAFTNNLTGFIEYDWYRFGTRTVNFALISQGGPPSVPIDIKEHKSVLKVGLNWKFGGPVVANY
jgi:outer membrane immunogenic protein